MDEWHIGDPVDWRDGWMDAQNWGHGQDDDDKKISSSYNDSEYQHYLRKAEECSRRGNHSEAIDYYEKARNGIDNSFVMILIAKEYEALGNQNYALTYWKDLCIRFSNIPDVFEGHANLAYRMGRYEEAIVSYRRELNIIENRSSKSQVKISRLNVALANAYEASGQSDIAESYRKLAKFQVDKYVKEKMELGDKYKEECNYFAARKCYKAVLYCEPNNDEANKKYDMVDRICNMDFETQERFRRDSLERKERLNKKRGLTEKDKEREEIKKKFEELNNKRIEREEKERKDKELRERNPGYLKLKIQSHKEVFELSHLRLHLGHYQKKSDKAFEEIFRLEKLLEKRKSKRSYPSKDINEYKKEIKHLKYCIGHFNKKYTFNAIKLLECYQKRLDELERKDN